MRGLVVERGRRFTFGFHRFSFLVTGEFLSKHGWFWGVTGGLAFRGQLHLHLWLLSAMPSMNNKMVDIEDWGGAGTGSSRQGPTFGDVGDLDLLGTPRMTGVETLL